MRGRPKNAKPNQVIQLYTRVTESINDRIQDVLDIEEAGLSDFVRDAVMTELRLRERRHGFVRNKPEFTKVRPEKRMSYDDAIRARGDA